MKRSVLSAVVLSGLVLAGACAKPTAPGPLEAGVTAARENRWDEAVRYWTAVLERDPGSAAAHNNLAVALEKEGDWDGAGREYEAALRLAPDSPEIKVNYESFRLRLEAGRKKGP
jgi:Flp pilus assembly protein TadD